MNNDTKKQLPELPASFRKTLPAIQPLSPQLKLVLTLIGEGWFTKEIADLLKISPKTVEYHRSKLFQIFKTNSIPMLVRLAIKMELVKN